MRTREKIEIPESQGFNFETRGLRAILEVLLDIRDILADNKKEI